MDKISSEHVGALMEDAGNALLKLAGERDALLAKNVELEAQVAKVATGERVEKVASAMIEKGLDSGLDRDSLVSSLHGWAAQGKLAEVERAVELHGPDMGTKIAQVYDGEAGAATSEGTAGGNGGDFMRFILE